MLQEYKTEERIWRWRWPIIVTTVLAVLLGIQIWRVNNRPALSVSEPETRNYTRLGRLVSGEVFVPPADFYSSRIDLNRRAKVSGEFRTGDLKSRVSVLVIREDQFERWKLDSNHGAIAQTGYVPGGKVRSVLEPGTYFLIIDNRRNNDGRQVQADFVLE